MSYFSGSISESHNAQATAPWVGEGWNLSLGSISLWVLIMGFNYFVPPSIVADPELAALELEENQNAGEADSDAGLLCSFTASTPVATETGKQAIGSLKTGEKVVSYNPKTKQTELEVIRHVWINHDDDLVDLTLTTRAEATKGKPAHQSSETLHTNKKHPFLTVEKGFVLVAQLKPGMHVVEAGNRTGVVTGWKSVSGAQTMYNLEVTQDHTFIVGAGQWIVHNDCGLNSEGYFRENYKVLTNDSGELRPNPGSIKTPLGVTDIDAETENSVVSVGTHSKFYDPDGTLNNKLVGKFFTAIDKYRSIANGRQVYFAYDTCWGDEPIPAKVLIRLAQ